MSKLREAFEARSGKTNKVEALKALKTPASVYDDLRAICAAGYENLKDEDGKFFLKCFGLFDKNDGTFMMRLRVPGGQLGIEQAEVIGDIARTHGRDYIDITTRQQIELRYIPFAVLPEVLEGLDAVGITTFQTGIDNFRNIVTSSFDGVAANSLIDCMPLIEELQSIFLKRDAWIGVLPRKFNTAILGTGTNDCNIYGHDCCFLPARRDGVTGFNLFLGGKVGVQAADSGLFVRPEQVRPVFEALISLFKTFGFRDNRNKNRLHFLIESVGMEAFSGTLAEASGETLAPSGTLLIENEHRIENGGVALSGDRVATLFPIPSGIFSGSDLIAAAECARSVQGGIRLSVEQSFYIVSQRSDVDVVTSSALYEKYARFNNLYFTHQIACAGMETCSFGVIPNKPDAIAMAEFLDRELPLDGGKIRMYWSACPKGCGIHGIADIGFEGCKAKDAEGNSCHGVHIFVGGKASFEAREGRRLFKAVPLDAAQGIVKKIVTLYKNERLEGESFEAYESRVLAPLDDEAAVAKIEAA